MFERTGMYKEIIENLHDGFYLVDTERVIQYWNKAAERISGFSADEVIGHACSDNILTHVDEDGNSLCLSMCPLAHTMDDGQPREAMVYLHHKDGHRVPVSVRVTPLRDENGTIIGGVELFTDKSNDEANFLRVKELEKLAMLDQLTQLANRHYLEKEFRARFDEQGRYNISFGILFMDIDFFKNFNDTYGHDLGDEILKMVARVFASSARPFDLFGRWGGEEFIAIIRNIDENGLMVAAERVRQLVKNSYISHGTQTLKVTISVGATLLRPGDTLRSILKRADELLYRSKETGRNRVTLG